MVSLRQTIKATLGASDADLANGVVDTCLNPLFKESGEGERSWLTYSGSSSDPSTGLSIRSMFETWDFPSSYTDTAYDYPNQSANPGFARQTQGLASAERDAAETLWFVINNEGQAVVSPPQYGRWQAGFEQVGSGAPATPYPWLRQLNLDPRHRGTASRGTKVVQDQQDALMSQAWEQIGQLSDVNKLHRWAQFSRQVGGVTHARLTGFQSGSSYATGTPFRKFHLLGPVLDRVVLQSGLTAHGELEATDLPEGTFSATLRRLLRSRGPKSKDRLDSNNGTYVVEEDLAKCNLEPARPEPENAERVSFPYLYYEDSNGELQRITNREPQDPALHSDFESNIQTFLNQVPEKFTSPATDQEERHNAIVDMVQAMQTDHLDAVTNPPAEPTCMQDIAGWVDEVEAGLNPESTLVDYIQSRVTLPGELIWSDDPLAPTIVAPEFPQPMYVPLAEKFPDLLLPGIGELPNNSVTALETNPHFIESYMCGLNHEMSREFLWREFPCDLRGSFFRQFWDIRGVVPKPQTEVDREALKDIEPIHGWGLDSDGLGQNMQTGTGEGRTVLLFRGELLKRYPNAIVYAIPATWDTSTTPATRTPDSTIWPTPFPDPATTAAEYPIFSGVVSPDIRFFGFTLSTDVAKGDPDPAANTPGYFFVIQQPPTEARLGLDNTGTVSWESTSCYNADGSLDWGCYIKPSDFSQDDVDGAGMASTLFQPPYRIAIHADDLIA